MQKLLGYLCLLLSICIFSDAKADIFEDIEANNIEAVKSYLEEQGDPNANGYEDSLLCLSLAKGRPDITKLLLKHNVNVKSVVKVLQHLTIHCR